MTVLLGLLDGKKSEEGSEEITTKSAETIWSNNHVISWLPSMQNHGPEVLLSVWSQLHWRGRELHTLRLLPMLLSVEKIENWGNIRHQN